MFRMQKSRFTQSMYKKLFNVQVYSSIEMTRTEHSKIIETLFIQQTNAYANTWQLGHDV